MRREGFQLTSEQGFLAGAGQGIQPFALGQLFLCALVSQPQRGTLLARSRAGAPAGRPRAPGAALAVQAPGIDGLTGLAAGKGSLAAHEAPPAMSARMMPVPASGVSSA